MKNLLRRWLLHGLTAAAIAAAGAAMPAQAQAAADNTIAWSWEEAGRKSDEFLQKAREAGIKVVELDDKQMSAAKQIVYDSEWPKMEPLVGKATMDKIRKIVGVK